MKFVTRSGFFKRGPNKDGHLDPDTIQTISKMPLIVNCRYLNDHLHKVFINYIFPTSLFQGALRFMLDASCQGPALHFLQEVSGCQTAWWRRTGIPFVFDCVSCLCINILSRWCPINIRVYQVSPGAEVRSTCVDALSWARRFLPFSCFLNAEEILQDILLSLVSELPPLPLVMCLAFSHIDSVYQSNIEWPWASTFLILAYASS